jgi:hypothetical protein
MDNAAKYSLFDLAEITEAIRQLSYVTMAVRDAMIYGPSDPAAYIPAVSFVGSSLSRLAGESETLFNALYDADIKSEKAAPDTGTADAAGFNRS